MAHTCARINCVAIVELRTVRSKTRLHDRVESIKYILVKVLRAERRGAGGTSDVRGAAARERVRGVAAITPRFAFRRRYIAHARTDVPALATFTVSQNALRAVIP